MGWVSFFQLAEKALWDKICLGLGGGTRGGSRPPRMGLNASGALLCKAPASGVRTFAPLCGTKVTAFFRLSKKSKDIFDSLKN